MTRSFTTREKVLLLILALLLIGLTYFMLIQLPVSSELTEITITKSETESALLIAQAKNQQMQNMQAELDSAAASASFAVVPEYDNLQNVMNYLNQTLSDADSFSLSFAPLDTSEQFVRRTVTMNFSTTGYQSAKHIVQTLAAAPFRVQVSGLSLSAADGVVSVSLTLTCFEAQASAPPVLTDDTADAAA